MSYRVRIELNDYSGTVATYSLNTEEDCHIIKNILEDVLGETEVRVTWESEDV